MKITNARTLVMGTPWRDLTFLILETDEGLKGVAEARIPNRTQGLLGYLEEALPLCTGAGPLRSREDCPHHVPRRFRPRGRDRDDRHRARRDRLLGHGAKALSQPVYRLMEAQPGEGTRPTPTAVSRRAHPGRVRQRGHSRGEKGLPGGKAGSFGEGLFRTGAG